MAVQLLSQTGAAEPAVGGTGPITVFSAADGIRVLQVNPATAVPFTGTLEIRGTNTPNPGAGDFAVLATIGLTGHAGPFTLYMQTNATHIQVGLTAQTTGEVAVFGDSNNNGLVGDAGTTQSQATAVVTSQLTITVVGTLVHISAPTVPSITSDDVTYAVNFNETVTDVLLRLDTFNGVITGNGVTVDDVSLLAGKAAFGLTSDDLCKLADVDASASDLNQTSGASGNFQTQIDAIGTGFVIGPGVDLTGLTTSAADIDALFDVSPTVTMTQINGLLTGLVSTAGDLNALAGTAGDVAAADFVKLGDITASAVEINVLNGVTASAAEINILAGLTASQGDLNTITGLQATGVGVTEFAFLSGLTENVQVALNTITPLSGLTSSVSDLNLLTGAATGTGAFSGGAITSNEIAALDGIGSNIQTQLDAKRNTADTIGIAEITGSSISTTELNFSSGLIANIQAQLDAIGTGFLSTSGGDMTGALCLDDGTLALPSLCFTNDPGKDTGIYRNAPGFCFVVDGLRVARWNATQLIVGDTTTSGQASILNTGFGEANPTYSFVGDPDTGRFWPGADEIGDSIGGKEIWSADSVGGSTAGPRMQLGGAVADNAEVEVSGVWGGERVLGRVSLLVGTSTGATGTTAMYTVPTARSAIITKLLVRITNSVTGGSGGDTAIFRMNVGIAGSFDEIVDNVNNPSIFDPSYGFDTAPQVMPLGFGDNTFPAISGSSGADYQVLTAGAVLTANVTVQADFDEFDIEVIAIGHEYL